MTNSLRRRIVLAGSAAICAGFAPTAARANKPTTLIVGFPPGGGIDLLARVIAAQIKQSISDTVLVDNKTGVAGRLALDYVKSAANDGSVLLLTPDFPLTIFPSIYKKLPYDPTLDFTPIGACAKSGQVLSVGPMVPASVQTVADFVRWANANESAAAYGSSGAGGILHFVGVIFNQATGAKLNHVPFRGSAPALLALIGGQIAATCTSLGEALPYRSSGLRPLVTFGPTRSKFMPDVPTMSELGYRSAQGDTWFGIFGPRNLPKELTERWNTALTALIDTPAYVAAVEKLSLDAFASSPAALGRLVRADIDRWAPVIKASGFTAES